MSKRNTKEIMIFTVGSLERGVVPSYKDLKSARVYIEKELKQTGGRIKSLVLPPHITVSLLKI